MSRSDVFQASDYYTHMCVLMFHTRLFSRAPTGQQSPPSLTLRQPRRLSHVHETIVLGRSCDKDIVPGAFQVIAVLQGHRCIITRLPDQIRFDLIIVLLVG